MVQRIEAMARRKDHTREELKNLILEMSWRLVGKEGPQGLSARRLADAIGYAPGTIYNVFPSMDALYLQVNARTLDLLHGVLSSPACHDPKKTPVQNMKKMAQLYRGFAQDMRPYWLMLFSHDLPETRKVEPWYQEKIDRLFTSLEILLAPAFAGKQQRKMKMAARILWASTHGLCFLEETGKMPKLDGESAFESMANYLIDSFVIGMKTAPVAQE